MTAQAFQTTCQETFDLCKRLTVIPIKTGNMKYNALRLEFPGAYQCRVYMDLGIAPYMPYTTERWEHKVIRMGNFRPGETVERMRTWDNPNEGWWKIFCETFIAVLAQNLGGELRRLS